jgi:hypothetical protein
MNNIGDGKREFCHIENMGKNFLKASLRWYEPVQVRRVILSRFSDTPRHLTNGSMLNFNFWFVKSTESGQPHLSWIIKNLELILNIRIYNSWKNNIDRNLMLA